MAIIVISGAGIYYVNLRRAQNLNLLKIKLLSGFEQDKSKTRVQILAELKEVRRQARRFSPVSFSKNSSRADDDRPSYIDNDQSDYGTGDCGDSGVTKMCGGIADMYIDDLLSGDTTGAMRSLKDFSDFCVGTTSCAQ